MAANTQIGYIRKQPVASVEAAGLWPVIARHFPANNYIGPIPEWQHVAHRARKVVEYNIYKLKKRLKRLCRGIPFLRLIRRSKLKNFASSQGTLDYENIVATQSRTYCVTVAIGM